MLEIIKKLTEEYENSGYPAVKSCFDKWLNEKKDITQKDEATVKLFMARICLAQEKFDDLAQFFNAGMSQTDKEELENLRRQNVELQKEIKNVKLEFETEVKKLLETFLYKFETQRIGSGYIFKDARKIENKDVYSYLNSLPKLDDGGEWGLCTKNQFRSIKSKINKSDFIEEAPDERFRNSSIFGTQTVTYIHPVYFLEN